MELFRRKPKPDELLKKWKRQLKSEERNMERSIRNLKLEEKKAEKMVKDAMKQNDVAGARSIAGEIARNRKQVSHLYNTKATLMSCHNQLSSTLASLRFTQTLSASTIVMQNVNELLNIPAMNQTMMAMAQEMEKAGIIEEMVNDMIPDEDEDELEIEDEDIQSVLDEIMGEKVKPVIKDPEAGPLDKLPAIIQEDPNTEPTPQLNDMQNRLEALRQ